MSTRYLYGQFTNTTPIPNVTYQVGIIITTNADGTRRGKYVRAAQGLWNNAGGARASINDAVGNADIVVGEFEDDDNPNLRTLLAVNVNFAGTNDVKIFGDITELAAIAALPTHETTTNYTGISFRGFNLTLCQFNQANGNTARTNFTNCSFAGTTMPLNLTRSSFNMCNMAGAVLNGANLANCDFTTSTGLSLLAGGTDDAGTKTISLVNDGAVGLLLPPFSGVTINTNPNPDTLSLTTPPTGVTVGTGFGQDTFNLSSNATSPVGQVIINTTQTVMNTINTDLGINNNIGKLIPLNVLKLAIAARCVVNIR
jgi:hypothetical protein